MKKYAIQFVLGALLALVFIGQAARFWQIPFVSLVDAYLYDVRVRLSAKNTVDPRIVIIDIDEKSLAEVGRWPWGRDKVSNLVRQLTDHYKATAVGFDVVFAEPDESSGLGVLENIGRKQLKDNQGYQTALKDLRQSLDYDRLFAETLKGWPVVLGYYFSDQEDARQTGALPPPLFPGDAFARWQMPAKHWNGYGGNLPQFQQAALTAGHFNPLVDFDGVSRRVPLLAEYDGNYYEALSLALYRQLLGQAVVRPGFPDKDSGIEWLEVVTAKEARRIPVDGDVAVLIPYRGPERSFLYVSAADVLKGKVAVEQLAGKAVLVGTSAPGLMDLRATPVGAAYPGVEIHANLVAGMLDGTIKEKPAYVLGIEVLQLLLFGGLLASLLPLLSPLRGALLAIGTLAVGIALNLALWHLNVVLPLASFILLTLLLYGMDASWGYFVESRTKKKLTGLFGQYVPPELVDEMAKDPENYSMEGRNQELTVLFADVRNFTTISEGLDPKELTQLMNAYLGEMTQVIRGNRGTLDKYIGDAIMAFWGAPIGDGDHARHALQTALAMQQALRRLDEPFKARGWPALHIGIGINTGNMTVGDMGSPVRQAYTVMGDAVNTASRFEGLTKQYGVGILVGEETQAGLMDFVFREIDRVRPKGKGEPVGIFEPLGLAGEIEQARLDELALWQQALRLYRLQDWNGAELKLLHLKQSVPECKLYDVYLGRIAQYRANPPGQHWNGVTTFETK
ncbi:MAG: CHASE2 domain-containing protein [Betaproteobacteria bacterium]